MEKITKTGTYLTHTIAVNDKQVRVLKMTFTFDDGTVAEVSIQSDKYIKFLSDLPEYAGVQTLEDVAEKVKAMGKVELHFNISDKFIGYSLTDSAYISTKTKMVKPFAEQELITKVEADDSAIAIYFEDGTISRRNFSAEVYIDGKKEYRPDPAKRLRFLQSMGVTGDLMTFDMQDLVGGRCNYMKQDNAFKAGEVWFKHENFTKAPVQQATPDFSRTLSPEEQLAMMANLGQ